MDSSGSGTVIAPLLALEREDLTGVLEFNAQGIPTRIYVRGGEIVFAEAGTVSETLGRLLIRRERLTEEQVVAVIRRMTDALVDNQHVRFGEVVVEYGFLTADELDIALTQQVKEKVMGCVHRGAGDWTFINEDPRIDDVGHYVVGTRPMLVEAALHLPERRIEDVLHLDENRYPEIVAPESIIIEEFELSREEASILRELDGTSSLHFILSTARSPNVLSLLAALVMGGALDLRQTPTSTRQTSEGRSVPPEFRTARRARVRLDQEKTMQMAVAPVKPPPSSSSSSTTSSSASPAPPPSRPPSSAAPSATKPGSLPPVTTPPMRSMPPASDRTGPKNLLKPPKSPSHSSPTIAVARAAPQRRSSRQNLEPPTFETQDRARDALDRLKSDLESRKPVSSRRRWPEPKDDEERRLMAEAAFHRGRMYLRAEDAERALPGLHRALELRPKEREYELYVKWAQMLVNDAFKNDEQRTEIQALAAKIVRENRDCELAFSLLGHCAMHDGKDEAALRFFQRAANLDPKLIDAARLARLLAMRSQSGGHRSPAQSKSDRAPGRSRLRGFLETPLDEIVPVVLQKAGEVVPRAGSMTNEVVRRPSFHSDRTTPTQASTPAGLGMVVMPTPGTSIDIEIAPATTRLPPEAGPTHKNKNERLVTPAATPAPPHASSAPPPRRTDGPSSEVAPAPLTPRAYPPPPSTPPPPPVLQVQTRALSPWRLPTSPVSSPEQQQQQQQQAPSVAPAAPTPPPMRARDFSIPDPPPPKRRAGVVLLWMASLGVTGGAAYYFGTRDAAPIGNDNISTTSSTQSASSLVSTTLASTSSTSVSTTVTTSSSSVVVAPSSSSSTSKPVASASASASASAGGGTTGVLHSRHAYGRRIYVDGRLVGEGGRDLTVPCGSRRIRVGSAGVERTMMVPCGGAIEVD